jgi:hypothetical protein
MTAPLPPLPNVCDLPMLLVTHSQQNSPAKRRHLQEFAGAYAKVAVREALERAAVKCDGLPEKTWHEGSDQFGNPCNWPKATTPRDCADAIRAMLNEYSDD